MQWQGAGMYESAQDRVSPHTGWPTYPSSYHLNLVATRRHVHGPTSAELARRVAHASLIWGMLAGLCRACHRSSIGDLFPSWSFFLSRPPRSIQRGPLLE